LAGHAETFNVRLARSSVTDGEEVVQSVEFSSLVEAARNLVSGQVTQHGVAHQFREEGTQMYLPEIIVEPWKGQALPKEDILPSLQYLAYKTQKPVTFRWYTENEGYSDQSISVRVFVKDGLAATYNPEHVAIGGETHALSSEQRGMAVALVQDEWKKLTDEEGQLIGCVDHNRVILPIEVTADDNDAARALLAFVIEQAVPLLDFDLGPILEEKEEEFAKHFTAAFNAGVRARLEVRKGEFSEKQREAEQAYYTVLDFEKEKPVLEAEISHLSKLAEHGTSSVARAQAKSLLHLQTAGTFSRVELNDNGVLLATSSPITIEHEGYEFPVGRYEIQIPANGDVRIKALDEHPDAEHPHPHVARDNRPCLGNISADLAKLIGKMRYAEALQLLHSFLSSYNPENPYEKIGHFDPSGQYQDEDDDPCENCDDKCTPYCIFSCDHNNEIYTCEDCCEHRSQYCYEECEHNEDFERFHPYDDCDRKETEHCYLKCRYNKEWDLHNPCSGCDEEEGCRHDECPYYQKRKEELEHAQAK